MVTTGLILLNVLVFVYELSLGPGLEAFVRTYGAVPREILTGRDLAPAGPNPLQLQLLTSLFIHGGWLHILSNMAYLHVFGDQIEKTLGRTLYLAFYLSIGIVASLTHIALAGANETTPSVGASGAIAGVLGAYLILFPDRQIRVLFPGLFFWTIRVSAFVMLGFWFVLQFLNGLAALAAGVVETDGVAIWAHIGGFLAGALLALWVRGPRRTRGLYSPRFR